MLLTIFKVVINGKWKGNVQKHSVLNGASRRLQNYALRIALKSKITLVCSSKPAKFTLLKYITLLLLLKYYILISLTYQHRPL